MKDCDLNNLNRVLQNVGDAALKRRAHWLVKNLDIKPGQKILDVGCGDGFYLHILHNLKLKLKLSGVDNDTMALATAEERFPKKTVAFFLGDIMELLPFENSSFDKIIMSEALEHLPDDVQGLKEVFRVLKPKGTLCLSVPNHRYPFLWDPVNWILEHLFGRHIKSGFWAGIWNQHVRLYERYNLYHVVKSAGFTIETSDVLTYWCLPFQHYLINLGARIIATGQLPSLAKGANKYESSTKRSFFTSLYFNISEAIDKLNDIWHPVNSGVSIVLSAVKQ